MPDAVGATLGAIAGAMIGWSNKKRFVGGVIVGAVYGTTLSYKLINDTFDYLFSDDADARVFLVNIVSKITHNLFKFSFGVSTMYRTCYTLMAYQFIILLSIQLNKIIYNALFELFKVQ